MSFVENVEMDRKFVGTLKMGVTKLDLIAIAFVI